MQQTAFFSGVQTLLRIVANLIALFFSGSFREYHVPHSPHPAQHLPQSRGRTHDHRKEEEEIDRKSRVSGFLDEVGF